MSSIVNTIALTKFEGRLHLLCDVDDAVLNRLETTITTAFVK